MSRRGPFWLVLALPALTAWPSRSSLADARKHIAPPPVSLPDLAGSWKGGLRPPFRTWFELEGSPKFLYSTLALTPDGNFTVDEQDTEGPKEALGPISHTDGVATLQNGVLSLHFFEMGPRSVNWSTWPTRYRFQVTLSGDALRLKPIKMGKAEAKDALGHWDALPGNGLIKFVTLVRQPERMEQP